ncbi:hypothetical protein MJH12_10965 [bacterium]|nr:hypothetical protein [bacterium]
MFKKINISIAIISLIILSGCDKDKGSSVSEMNPSYHNLPADVQAELREEVDSSDDYSNLDLANLDQSSSTLFDDTSDTDLPEGTANASILREAESAMNESSAAGPDGGNLACAWMVNKILKRSVGFKVDGDSTYRMNNEFKALVSAGKVEKIELEDRQPGDIILSPTGKKVGHVGIIGESNQIYSNRSSAAKWGNSFTVNRWNAYYGTQRNLAVNVYRILS